MEHRTTLALASTAAVSVVAVLAGCDPIVWVHGRVLTLEPDAPQFLGTCVSSGEPWPSPPVSAVAAARVTAWDPERSVWGRIGQAESGADGSFSFQQMGFDPREIRLRVEAPGYRTFDAIVSATSPRNFDLNVVLAREPQR